MPAFDASTLFNLAEPLQDDEIHVWQLAYRPALRREPLRRLLAAYLGNDPTQVTLLDDADGRPALAPHHDQTLGFNWSHSGAHAVIALGRRIRPGIDIELRHRRPRALPLARRFFSPDETAALAALPPDQQGLAFLQLWTAKEAVLKALGRGLAFGLHRLSIESRAGELQLQRLEGDDVRDWQLLPLTLDAALVGALAWRGGTRRVRYFTRAVDG